jgi:Ca2+-binding RTX toxin-like protein
MLLLSDGTVMAQEGYDPQAKSFTSKHWYKLTPDSSGSYVNGTWSSLASMSVGRLYYASDVLPDGRVYVAGGEYATDKKESTSGEIYDPAADSWSSIANYPDSELGDGISETLPDGRILQGDSSTGNLHIYNPATNMWSDGPTLPSGDESDEEGWVKLPDGSTLDYEIQGSQPHTANRLVLGATDAQDQWVSAGSVPVALDSKGGNDSIVPEIGPGVLLPDGRVFWIGASGHTALYRPPSGSGTPGTWTQGPDILDNQNNLLGGFDAPAAVEPNGKVLFAAGQIDGTEPPPPSLTTTIFEYDPTANTITQVTASGPSLNHPVFMSRMLVLPSGQILYSTAYDAALSVYNPDSSPSSGWAPTISGISSNGGGTFTLTGTQLNGLDEGAGYGDDAQMASNYPIVRLTAPNGQVTFAKTFNWSSNWVATGTTPESTQFTLPPQDGPGVYSLSVIANGITSSSVVFVVGSSGNDTVTIDTSNLFGAPTITATLDGVTSSYNSFGVPGVYVFPEGGSNTVDIEHSLFSHPVTVDLAGGSATVNISRYAGDLGNIRGDVNVVGDDNSADGLALYDLNNASEVTYRVDSSSVLRDVSATISYSGMGIVSVNGGSASDTYNIESTASGIPMWITGGAGNDTFNVSPSAMNLAGIQATLTVSGLGGNNFLYLNDQNNPTSQAYSVTSATVSRSGAAPINYSFEAVSLYGGSGNDTYNIESTPSGTPLFAQGGGGNDTFNISPTAQDLNGIQGDVVVSGGGGQNTGNIYDGSNPRTVAYTVNTVTYSVTSTTVTRTGAATVSYDSNVQGMTLYGGSANNRYDIESTSSSTPVTVNAGGGNDSIEVSPTARNLDTIAGALTITGVAGTDSLDIVDVTHPGATTYSVTSSSVNRAGAAPIHYAAMAGLGLDGGTGDDTYNIESTAASTPVNIAAGAGANTFKVSPTARKLGTIRGNLDVYGVNNTNALVLDDQANSANGRYSLAGPTVSRTGTATISYDTINRLVLNGGGGNDVYNLNGTPAGVKLALVAGKGNDTFRAIATASSSSVSVSGGGGSDTLVGPNVASTWKINGSNAGTVGDVTFAAVSNVSGGSADDAFKFASGGSLAGKVDGGKGTNTLDYSGDGGAAATVNLATAAATKTGGFANIEKFVGSSSAADKLVGPNATGTWKITANNGGTVGSFSFSGVENLTGGTGIDEFVFSAGKTVSGKIDGGGAGNDWLDYAAYATPVTVNLAANTATGVGGGIANIRNVRGGQGGNTLTGNALGNILIGGNGVDTIAGGSGRSILIGGRGNDVVKGGSADDIVIGGFTDYDTSSDAHDQAILAILAEWQSSDPYLTRIAKIKAGVGGAKLVFGTTVHDDGNASTLTGGPGTDWFFKGAHDIITDRNAATEEVN